MDVRRGLNEAIPLLYLLRAPLSCDDPLLDFMLALSAIRPSGLLLHPVATAGRSFCFVPQTHVLLIATILTMGLCLQGTVGLVLSCEPSNDQNILQFQLAALAFFVYNLRSWRTDAFLTTRALTAGVALMANISVSTLLGQAQISLQRLIELDDQKVIGEIRASMSVHRLRVVQSVALRTIVGTLPPPNPPEDEAKPKPEHPITESVSCSGRLTHEQLSEFLGMSKSATSNVVNGMNLLAASKWFQVEDYFAEVVGPMKNYARLACDFTGFGAAVVHLANLRDDGTGLSRGPAFRNALSLRSKEIGAVACAAQANHGIRFSQSGVEMDTLCPDDLSKLLTYMLRSPVVCCVRTFRRTYNDVAKDYLVDNQHQRITDLQCQLVTLLEDSTKRLKTPGQITPPRLADGLAR